MKKFFCKLFKCPTTPNPDLDVRVDQLEKELKALKQFVEEGPRYG